MAYKSAGGRTIIVPQSSAGEDRRFESSRAAFTIRVALGVCVTPLLPETVRPEGTESQAATGPSHPCDYLFMDSGFIGVIDRGSLKGKRLPRHRFMATLFPDPR